MRSSKITPGGRGLGEFARVPIVFFFFFLFFSFFFFLSLAGGERFIHEIGVHNFIRI